MRLWVIWQGYWFIGKQRFGWFEMHVIVEFSTIRSRRNENWRWNKGVVMAMEFGEIKGSKLFVLWVVLESKDCLLRWIWLAFLGVQWFFDRDSFLVVFCLLFSSCVFAFFMCLLSWTGCGLCDSCIVFLFGIWTCGCPIYFSNVLATCYFL